MKHKWVEISNFGGIYVSYECSECKLFVLEVDGDKIIYIHNLAKQKQFNSGKHLNLSCEEMIIKNIIE